MHLATLSSTGVMRVAQHAYHAKPKRVRIASSLTGLSVELPYEPWIGKSWRSFSTAKPTPKPAEPNFTIVQQYVPKVPYCPLFLSAESHSSFFCIGNALVHHSGTTNYLTLTRKRGVATTRDDHPSETMGTVDFPCPCPSFCLRYHMKRPRGFFYQGR